MTDLTTASRELSSRILRSFTSLMLGCSLALCAMMAVASESNDGFALLQKAKQAANELDYKGTFIYHHGSSLVASEIAHHVLDGQRQERIAVLDGPKQREFLRIGKKVYSLLPEHEVVLVEVRETDHFPGWITGDPHDLAAYYKVELIDQLGRVAGRPCVQARVLPRDEWRWGYRLCVDQATGLLLKLQTLDANGDVLEQAAFSELSIGQPLPPEVFESSFNWQEWPHIQGGQGVDLAVSGWKVDAPAGFTSVSQLRRKLKGRAKVHQMVLTDGLAAISVFIEPMNDDVAGRQASLSGYGANSIFRGPFGEHWLTVLGEVPPHTVKAVADAVRQ